MNTSEPIKYIDRASGELHTETVMGSGALNFAYNTLLGRSLWGLLFKTSLLSDLMGWYYDSKLSRRAIKSLVDLPGLEAAEAEKDWREYPAFNDFFTRKLKTGSRTAAAGDNVLCSPADGRILIYPDVEPDVKVPVKGAVRSLEELCGMPIPLKKCSVAVVRLAPVDYHRYHFPCDCTQKEATQIIAGKYHSVNPIALLRHPDLFVENTRHITVLENPQCGIFRMIEVAAFGVGSIIRSAEGKHFSKMDEKGFFKFGGSTVILVFKAGKVTFDNDLITASANGMETAVTCGSRIAILKTDNMEG